ncbi:dTDP-D-glucose 4,6-dehydratase [Holothuria leucospilota]|uniref:dTDP-D-glucose 4,6-dehydratase n=1 Tax=Holothuria leucospilota TaxID=206669 RepID=A0A9Q1H351_HOLLE|nr:dTDP-D-glucose 4,6-dehydratase [Holothuria leucospilota]
MAGNGQIVVENGHTTPSNGYHRRILFSGGSGFIGSHVVDKLVLHPHIQYYVVNYDKLDYCASLKNNSLVEGKSNYKFVKGDINDKLKLLQVMKNEKCDTVMHFAAQSHVDNSFRNDKPFHEANVKGTQTLLEAAREYGISLFLHVSTDEVYGGESIVPLTESAELNPTNPYSKSKAMGEKLARSYWNKYGFPVIVTRGNNVYGPRQYPEKVIPKFISLLQNGRKCCIHGDGSPSRNFMYVDDAATAYLTVLGKGRPGEIYNIGTDFRTSIKELSETIIRKILPQVPDSEYENYIEFVKDRPHNDKSYLIDSSKLENLGWKPLMQWEKGLDITVRWYAKNFDNWPRAEEALAPFPGMNEQK